jgi:arabinogalactan oligomer/maltooligosaccharide transport system substrate-binding protein
MEVNHQDNTESKQTTAGDKSQLPLLSRKDEEIAQKELARLSKRLRKDRKKPKQLPIIVGISAAFVGVLVLSYLWFRFNWQWEVLIPLISIGIVLLILLIRLEHTVQWVGFSGKTGWDWLNLIGVLLVPLMIGVFTIVSSIQQSNIAADQQQETILKTYLDDMSNLLLTQHLSTSKPGEPVREVASEQTLITLRRLHADRNKIVLGFLQEAHLIGIQGAVINLSNADLSNVELDGIDLSNIDLSGDILNGAHLHGADLYDAHLNNADLDSIDLGGADLSEALLSNATLRSANLYGARLSNANLIGAFLGGANLNAATLYSANLNGADLSNANLYSARLDGAHLNNADLSDVDLSNANLSDVDLSDARDLTQPQLDTVSSCTIKKNTNLPRGLTCNHSSSMVTLTYWYTENPEEMHVIQRLIDQFEQQNPNIQINAVNKNFFQTQAAFETAAQAGQAPDVLRADVGWVAKFASQHYLLNIDQFVSESQLDLSDYLSAPLSYDKYNGHLYGLPQVTDFLALLYNRDEFRKAGIPSPPPTMLGSEGLEADAIKIVQNKAAKYGFETTGTAYYELPFLWAFGGDMIDQHNHILVADEGSVAGLSFLLKLQNYDRVMPPPGDFSNGYNNMVNDFKIGKTAMIFDGPYEVLNILNGTAFQGNRDNLRIAAIPMGPSGGQRRSSTGGNSYVISADTAHPYEAYKFISFMSSENSQATIAQNNHTLPTLNSAYHDQRVKSDPLISAFSSSSILNTAHARPVIPQVVQLFEAFDPNIVAALDETKSVPDALNAVAEAWKQLIPDAS